MNSTHISGSAAPGRHRKTFSGNTSNQMPNSDDDEALAGLDDEDNDDEEDDDEEYNPDDLEVNPEELIVSFSALYW